MGNDEKAQEEDERKRSVRKKIWGNAWEGMAWVERTLARKGIVRV